MTSGTKCKRTDSLSIYTTPSALASTFIFRNTGIPPLTHTLGELLYSNTSFIQHTDALFHFLFMGFTHVTFFAAAIYGPLSSLSLVIRNQNNTSPTKRILVFKNKLGLDPYLLSNELLTPLKSGENCTNLTFADIYIYYLNLPQNTQSLSIHSVSDKLSPVRISIYHTRTGFLGTHFKILGQINRIDSRLNQSSTPDLAQFYYYIYRTVH